MSPSIDGGAGIDALWSIAGRRGKVDVMTNFVDELKVQYPTHEEVEAVLREAHRLRARAAYDGLIGIRNMLQRVVRAAPATAKPQEA